MPRRLVGLALFAGSENERPQMCSVDFGVRRAQFVECLGVRQQAIAPGFQPMQGGGITPRALRPFFQAHAQRCGIDIPHQASQVLHLPASSLAAGNAPGLCQGIAQSLGEVELGQALRSDAQQGFAQILQCVHLLLAAGLGRLVIRQAGFIGGRVVQVRVPLRASCYDNPLSKTMMRHGRER